MTSSLYSYYRGPLPEAPLYRAWFGRPGTPEYREAILCACEPVTYQQARLALWGVDENGKPRGHATGIERVLP